MVEEPDAIRAEIDRTRARLDRHLDDLDEQVQVKKEELAASAQYWGGIMAVAIGTVGALAFWPRRRQRPGRRLHNVR
jgi:hypothetical protein